MAVLAWPFAAELQTRRLTHHQGQHLAATSHDPDGTRTFEPLRIEHAEAGAAVTSWLRHQGHTTFAAHVHPDNVASAVTAHRLGMSPTPALLDGEIEWCGRPRPAPG